MARTKKDDDAPDEPKTGAEVADAIATAKAEAEEQQLDETVPGGRYLVDGVYKDADGNVLGKPKKGEA